MQKCRQKIEEAWSVAREEAEKCKVAKEVIKALALRVISIISFFMTFEHRSSYTILMSWGNQYNRFLTGSLIKELLSFLQIHTMSEKVSGRSDAKEVDANKPHVTPLYSDGQNFDHLHSPSAATCLPPEVQLPKDRPIGDSLYNSPIVFSNTFKSLYGRHAFRHVNKSAEDPNTNRTSAKNGTANYLKDEWIEQYEPGVYITFTSLPGGHKGLKRVRFRY